MMKDKHICLVEDDNAIQEMVEYVLLTSNYRVTSFGTAGSFRRGIKDIQPDLFILDIMLPDGNGIAISEELKAQPGTSDVPILLMSAHESGEGIPASAEDFISKPFDIDDFLQRVKKLMA